MALPHLPDEILLEVTHQLGIQGDHLSWKNCSLAARTFLRPNQELLFRAVQLSPRTPGATPAARCKAFREILQKSPHLGSYVRKLELVEGVLPELDQERREIHTWMGDDQHLPSVLMYLSNLRSLRFTHLGCGSVRWSQLSHSLISALHHRINTGLQKLHIGIPFIFSSSVEFLSVFTPHHRELNRPSLTYLALCGISILEQHEAQSQVFQQAVTTGKFIHTLLGLRLFELPEGQVDHTLGLLLHPYSPIHIDCLACLEILGPGMEEKTLVRVTQSQTTVNSLVRLELDAWEEEGLYNTWSYNPHSRIDLFRFTDLRELLISSLDLVVPPIWLYRALTPPAPGQTSGVITLKLGVMINSGIPEDMRIWDEIDMLLSSRDCHPKLKQVTIEVYKCFGWEGKAATVARELERHFPSLRARSDICTAVIDDDSDGDNSESSLYAQFIPISDSD